MTKNKLDGKIDDIVEMLMEGVSYRDIAKKLDVSLSHLHAYTTKDEHSARVREAMRYSAQTWDDKAEEVLKDAKGTMTEIQRARELAQHYRWRASKRNPREYGDKLDLTSGGDKLAPVIIDWSGKHDNKPDTEAEGGA